jgi:hypothetical protein
MVVRGRGRFIGGHSEQAFGKTPTHRRDLAREDGVLGVVHRVALAAVALRSSRASRRCAFVGVEGREQFPFFPRSDYC